MKFNRYLNILITVLLVILICITGVEIYSRVQKKKLAQLAEQEYTKQSIPSDENSITMVSSTGYASSEDIEGETVLSYENFLKGCRRSSHQLGETSVTYRFSKKLTSGGADVYLLKFRMCAGSETATVGVRFGGEYTAYLTTEWREFYYPCTKGEVDSIKLTLETPFQKIYLSDLEVIKYDALGVKLSELKSGSYNATGIPEHFFSEYEGIGAGETMDVVCDGEYLYSAGAENLKIFKINEQGPTLVSTLYGIGNIRHIAQRDEKLLVAASRETGVYMINIEDKTNPYIQKHYDSLELANDVCFSGDYMFVASRYFGVEIVDISDVSNPVYITRIVNDKECYRCTVSGNYLFVSCWATCEAEIYDISDLMNSELVSSIPVEGRCAEVFVDGEVAYIASGYHALTNATTVGDVGYGTGNALNIYDISRIDNPVWKSTIKTEGSLFGIGYDDWSVQVSDGYAYFTNSFGGLYIYDVSNITSPIAVAHVATKILPDSLNFRDFSKSGRGIYPYDVSEYIYSPVMGVCVGNKSVFFACAYTDVYEYKFDKAKVISKENVFVDYVIGEEENLYDVEYKTFLKDYDVLTLIPFRDGYLAGANEGLLLLDENLNLISQYNTQNPVKDVKVTDKGIIVCAERVSVTLYKVENNQFVRLGVIYSEASNKNVSAIGVTGDGSFVITQSSWTNYEAIDIRNPASPQFVSEVISKNGGLIGISSATKPGNMYYRNIVSGTVDGAVGIGGNDNMIWFGSENGLLRVMNSYVNKFGSEVNGSAVTKNKSEILSVYNNGYVVYEPLKTDETALNKVERYYIPNVRLKGKISVNGDILVVCNEPSGTIRVVNISKIEAPYLIESYTIKGSPGIPVVEDNRILVPVRHGGIIEIVAE